jgi:hypothetical protein
MALKVSSGVSRKLGLPEYSSVGAICNVEFEVDQSLLQNDLEAFQETLRRAYVACSQAVDDELARQTNRPAAPSDDRKLAPPPQRRLPADAATDGHRQEDRSATEKQRSYIEALVERIESLGNGQLSTLTEAMFGKGIPEMNSREASALIVTLRGIRDGRLDVATALEGANDG